MHIRENIKIINNVIKGIENSTMQQYNTGELQALVCKYHKKHCKNI